MCAPCIVIIVCCGEVNAAAAGLIAAEEGIGEAVHILYDGGNLSEDDLRLIGKLSTESREFARTIDAFRIKSTSLIDEIAQRTPGYNDPKK